MRPGLLRGFYQEIWLWMAYTVVCKIEGSGHCLGESNNDIRMTMF